jgi:competence protein ComEC
MSLIFSICMILANWYYIPPDSPFVPTEVEDIDLNLREHEIAVTFLPLSNGEATLIQNSLGENILLNAGHRDTEVELKRLLSLYKVDKISTVILTSLEEEYVGNFNMLTEDYDVKQIITSKTIYEKVVEQQSGQQEKQDIEFWTQGTKQMLFNDLEAEVLFTSEAEAELDLSFTYKNERFLLLTSMTEASTDHLLTLDLSNVSIVKIPKFAREESISRRLLKHMDPELAVIFQAANTEPHEDILKLLQEMWLDVHYTKMHGILTIKMTPTNHEIISITKSKE